jgi:hypothetical protein
MSLQIDHCKAPYLRICCGRYPSSKTPWLDRSIIPVFVNTSSDNGTFVLREENAAGLLRAHMWEIDLGRHSPQQQQDKSAEYLLEISVIATA